MTFRKHSSKVTFWLNGSLCSVPCRRELALLKGGDVLSVQGKGGFPTLGCPSPMPSARSQFKASSEKRASASPAPFLAFPHLVTLASLPTAQCCLETGSGKYETKFMDDIRISQHPPPHSNAKNTIFQEKEVARKINNFESRDQEKALGS